jgi:hypothetical protein
MPTVPGLIERFRDADVVVYENPAAFPRAFLAGAVQVELDGSAVLGRLRRASLADLAGTVVVTRDADALAGALRSSGAADVAGVPGVAGTAVITRDTPDRIEIDVRPERGAILVLTDTAAPGWVAFVDGVPVDIRTVDAAFRGVPLTPTARHVVLRYEPGFTYLGFVISALAGVAATIWTVWVGRRRRDQGRSPRPVDRGGQRGNRMRRARCRPAQEGAGNTLGWSDRPKPGSGGASNAWSLYGSKRKGSPARPVTRSNSSA